MARRIFDVVRDRRGAAAVEFALVLPFLFTMYMGSAEFLQAFQAHRRLSHMAAAMADITCQSRTVTTTELDDVFAAGGVILYPLPGATLRQRISSFVADGSGTVTREWSAYKNWTDPTAATLPAGYLKANESVIVTDVTYDYKPTFGLFLPRTIKFVRHAYVRPRLSAKVEKI